MHSLLHLSIFGIYYGKYCGDKSLFFQQETKRHQQTSNEWIDDPSILLQVSMSLTFHSMYMSWKGPKIEQHGRPSITFPDWEIASIGGD